MPQIFISYRRADSRKDVGRLYDRLIDAFGREYVFKDVENIPFGSTFPGVIAEALARTDIVLVVIGRQWINIVDDQGTRRLDDPNDFVRIEVETALSRDGCLVIPVLVDGATMPRQSELPLNLAPLALKNAVIIRDDPDFNTDVGRLIQSIQSNPRFSTQDAPKTRPLGQIRLRLAVILAAIIVGIFLIGVVLAQLRNEQIQAAQQTDTAVAQAKMAASTGTAISLLPSNTIPQLSSPVQPSATNTVTQTLTLTTIPSTATSVILSPSSMAPTLIAPITTSTVAPSAANNVVLSTSTAPSTVVATFPCSAVVVNPDGDATLVTAVYDQVSDTSPSGQSVHIADTVIVQRSGRNGNSDVYYLISSKNQRVGWIAARFLKLSEPCFR